MQIKRWVVMIFLLGLICIFVIQVSHSMIVNSKLSPVFLVNVLQEEGFVIRNDEDGVNCGGPLGCGEDAIAFEACADDDCVRGDVVLYSGIREARKHTSYVNGMNCVLGCAIRRGRLVLRISCSDGIAERIIQIFKTASPD